MKKLLLPLVFSVFVLLLSQQAYADIDIFNPADLTGLVNLNAGPGGVDSVTVTDPNIIGGEMLIFLIHDSGPDAVTAVGGASPNLVSWDVPLGNTAILEYDISGPLFSGLGGVDLTEGGTQVAITIESDTFFQMAYL